ncbi:MAG: hypothetical protein K2J82_11740 [Muribaculaceae bacterium]|nr:hypothetical protein [Muribaculaceae bacterium]MDE6755264.1 hypothetical protein [Muribaculaceae bacterium]
MGTSSSVAYVWAIVFCLVFLLIAAIVAFLIPNKPGGKDIGQRKMWFWIFFVLSVALGFCINFFIANGIVIPTRHADYMTASGYAAGIGALIYIVLGIVISKGMKHSKLGDWF